MTAAEPLDLDPIRERAQAATPGPWSVAPNRCIVNADGDRVVASVAASGMWPSPADGAFIAGARQDIPALLAEIDRLNVLMDDVYRGGYQTGRMHAGGGRA